MPVVGEAPCQCRFPGGIETTSPGRISSTGPPSICTRPMPVVTMSVCPRGCVCHALRAPGSNVTYAPEAWVESFAAKSGSIRTDPVKYSAGPFCEGCEPARAMESETTAAAVTMFMSFPSSFLEQLLRLGRGGKGARPARVEREMGDELDQLLLCHTVFDGAREVKVSSARSSRGRRAPRR